MMRRNKSERRSPGIAEPPPPTERKGNSMTALKMLPWLAHKAGISDERAEELWAEAVRHATDQTGATGGSEHSQAAIDRLHELIEDEKVATRSNARWPYSLIMKLKRQAQGDAEGSVLEAFEGSHGVGVLP